MVITDNGMMGGLPKIYNETMVGGLNNLLEADTEAREYYMGLPKEKQDMLFENHSHISSFEALRKAVDGNL